MLLCYVSDIISQRISKGRSVLYLSRGIGSGKVPVTVNVLSKLYWTIAIPKMLYGVEVTPISKGDSAELENAHRQHAKLIQGLPMNIPNPAPLATMGWLSIDSYIAMKQMLFMWRTLTLSCDNVYKQIMVHTLKQCFHRPGQIKKNYGPVAQIYIIDQ